MVYLIEKGGNYGWSVTEGSHPFRPERKKRADADPAADRRAPHTEFRSLTGGYVYRGTRLTELAGAYIYGDYDTGKIWALRYDGGKKVDRAPRAGRHARIRIVAFGEDAAGELYLVDFIGGGIHRLVPVPAGRDGRRRSSRAS